MMMKMIMMMMLLLLLSLFKAQMVPEEPEAMQMQKRCTWDVQFLLVTLMRNRIVLNWIEQISNRNNSKSKVRNRASLLIRPQTVTVECRRRLHRFLRQQLCSDLGLRSLEGAPSNWSLRCLPNRSRRNTCFDLTTTLDTHNDSLAQDDTILYERHKVHLRNLRVAGLVWLTEPNRKLP